MLTKEEKELVFKKQVKVRDLEILLKVEITNVFKRLFLLGKLPQNIHS